MQSYGEQLAGTGEGALSSLENHTILAGCLSEPGCSGEFWFQIFHHLTLTYYQRLPGHVDTGEFCVSAGTEKMKTEEASQIWVISEKAEKRGRKIVDLRGNINIVSQMHLRFPYALQIQFPW